MKKMVIPTWETLEQHATLIPEINPSAVVAMLRVMEASAAIQHAILDILEKDYQLSEGKLCVMIVLHHTEGGIAPSRLADMAGVTRATISVMLRRMQRDGLVLVYSDAEDGRAKKVCLSATGRNLMGQVLPEHYLRITKLMGKLSKSEQQQLIVLLKKIVAT